MLGLWLFLAIIFCMVFGWVGVAIASNKGVSAGAGFWLGFFLGPIGLVIVALLSPPAESQPTEPSVPTLFEGERDLRNDAYKLWLTSHYDIKKNDVLESYVCQEHLFPTVQAALEYADEQYQSGFAAAEAEAQRMAEQQERWREADERQRDADDAFERSQIFLIIVGTLIFIGLCYLIYFAL